MATASAGFDDDDDLEALARAAAAERLRLVEGAVRPLRRAPGGPRPRAAAVGGAEVLQRLRPQRGPQGRDEVGRRADLAARWRRASRCSLFKSHRPDYADGGQMRDFVYVDDAVDVIPGCSTTPRSTASTTSAPARRAASSTWPSAVFAAAGTSPPDRLRRHARGDPRQVPVLHRGQDGAAAGRRLRPALHAAGGGRAPTMSAASCPSRTPIAEAARLALLRLGRLDRPCAVLVAGRRPSAVIWRDDILRTPLDPKVPFQTYEPPPAPDYAAPGAWALLPPTRALDRRGRRRPTSSSSTRPPTTAGDDWNGPIDDRASRAPAAAGHAAQLRRAVRSGSGGSSRRATARPASTPC